MDLNNTLTLISILGGILTIVAGVLGLLGSWRGWWESPARREERERNQAVADVILGEMGVADRAGGVIVPKQVGLVARVSTVEDAVVDVRRLLTLESENKKRIEIHDAAINALIAGAIERAATAMSTAAMHTENAAMFDMVAKRDSDVIDPQEEP